MFKLKLVKRFYYTHLIEYEPIPDEVVWDLCIKTEQTLVSYSVYLAKEYKLDTSLSGGNVGDLFNFKSNYEHRRKGKVNATIEIVYRLHLSRQDREFTDEEISILNTKILKAAGTQARSQKTPRQPSVHAG